MTGTRRHGVPYLYGLPNAATGSQADSAGSIPVTRSRLEAAESGALGAVSAAPGVTMSSFESPNADRLILLRAALDAVRRPHDLIDVAQASGSRASFVHRLVQQW